MSDTILEVSNLKKYFKTKKGMLHAVDDVSFKLQRGRTLGVVGESGCGKSTLGRAILRLIEPTSGSVIFDGKDYANATDAELTAFRRSAVGFIFQAYNLMPTLTAEENLNFIGELAENPMTAAEALESVGLLEKRKNYPGQMSGGQQQRISIARALVKRPRLILADEPTAALDYETSIEVLSVLENVIKSGTTLLMVTHNEEIAKMANRVIRMKGGVVSEVVFNHHPASARELVW